MKKIRNKKGIWRRVFKNQVKQYRSELENKTVFIESDDREISINLTYIQILESYFETEIINNIEQREIINNRYLFYKDDLTFYNIKVSENTHNNIKVLINDEKEDIDKLKKQMIETAGPKLEKFVNKLKFYNKKKRA